MARKRKALKETPDETPEDLPKELKDLPEGHDLSHLEWALGFVKRFHIAIDGGAHTGIWTRRLMESFDHVISFEPVEANRAQIPTGGRVYPYALGEENKRVSMEPGDENTGQYHVAEGSDVEMRTLDSLNLTCNFLKMDVEGYELQALKGAVKLIKRCKPVIMIEENGLCERYGVKPMEADAWLKTVGYRCVGNMNKDYLYTCSR